MKIIKFTAENVKRLKAVEITPDGNIVRITGKNRAGKSSVLDAIEMALSGKKAASRSALRKDTQKGKVTLDLGEFTITRTWSENSNYLKVETKDGFERKSPQKFLDDIVGAVSFDPMVFINADSKKQRQLLLDFSGIEIDTLDEQRKEFFDSRTVESRSLRDAEGTLKTLESHPDAPDKPVSISDLLEEIDKAKRWNKTKDDLLVELDETTDAKQSFLESASVAVKDLKDMEKQMNDLRTQIDADRESAKALEKKEARVEKAIVNFKGKDVDGLKDKLENTETINNQVRANQVHAEATEKVKTYNKRVKLLTNKIDGIDAEKTQAVEKSKLPIKGLSFSDDAVLYNGVELDAIAQSEKISVGLAISMALNPKLKVLRITDGSLLDSGTWKTIAALVKKNDYQIWVEQVDETGKLGFYLEDGSIK